MHFYPYAFTKNKEPTITPKNKKVSITLQIKSLTVIWILTITFYRFLNLNDRDKSQLRWSVRALKARKLPSLPPEKIVKYCCPETPFYCSKTTAISVGNIPINWPSFFCLFSIYLKKQERNNGQTRDLFYRRTRLSRETKFHARAFKKKQRPAGISYKNIRPTGRAKYPSCRVSPALLQRSALNLLFIWQSH